VIKNETKEGSSKSHAMSFRMIENTCKNNLYIYFSYAVAGNEALHKLSVSNFKLHYSYSLAYIDI